MVYILQESAHDVSVHHVPEISQENPKEKRKKEKPVVMSLDEFRMTAHTNGIGDSVKFEKHHFVTELDDFLERQDDSTVDIKGSQPSDENFKAQGQSS